MGEHRKSEEDDHRHRHLTEDAPLAQPDETRFEAADRAAGGEEKRGAAKRRHTSERDHKRWHLQPGNRKALQEPSD